jgi:hypothetical protein
MSDLDDFRAKTLTRMMESETALHGDSASLDQSLMTADGRP